MSNEETRDRCIDYLIKSGFIEAYVKKLMFNSEIDNLYQDYVQEVYLAILEVPTEKISKLYNNSVENEDKDEFYQLRNWISRLIYNTVHSDSSNAYKKLKRHSLTERIKNDVQWSVYKNSIPETTEITEQIRGFNE